jgi:hypothetical protein
MEVAAPVVNPFGLLTDPEAIFRAVEASQRLDSLNRRVCRPLDRMPRGEGEGEQDEAAERNIPRWA